MRRETENLLLLLVGVSIAMITIVGSFTRYVKPSLLPWLAATAAGLIVLAIAAILTDVRRGGPAPTHDGHDGHTHRSGITWLLVLPVVMLVFVTPPALQANSSSPGPAAASVSSVRRPYPALPAGRAPDVSLPDVVLRSQNDSSNSLHDRLITVTGFVVHEADSVDLGRVVIICCAADAQLARLHLGGDAAHTAAQFPDNTWLRVEGTVTPAEPRPDVAPVPTLDATAVKTVDAPPNPYAYPGSSA